MQSNYKSFLGLEDGCFCNEFLNEVSLIVRASDDKEVEIPWLHTVSLEALT